MSGTHMAAYRRLGTARDSATSVHPITKLPFRGNAMLSSSQGHGAVIVRQSPSLHPTRRSISVETFAARFSASD